MGKTLDQPRPYRIRDNRHDNRDGRRRALCSHSGDSTFDDDDINPTIDQLSSESGDSVVVAFRRPPLDDDVTSFGVTGGSQSFAEFLHFLALGRVSNE